MPDFDFTAPDGKKYTVTGPEGSTPEQAFQMLQKQLASAPAQSYSGANAIPGASPEADAEMARWRAEMAARGPDKPKSFADKLIGAGETALSVGSGLTTGAAGMLGGAVAGAVGNLTDGRFGMKGGVEEGMRQGAESLTYAPRTAAGQEYAQAVGSAVQDSGVMGLPIGPEFMALGNLAAPAAKQAINGVRNSTELYIAQKLAQKAANVKLTPKIDRERAELAQKAAAIGIEAPLHTLTGNKLARMTGEFLDNLPLSGSVKADNEVAFNRSLIEQIGGNPKKAEKLTPQVFGEALKKSGDEIGEVFSKINVPFADEALQADLAALKSTLPRVLSDTERVIVGNMDELARLAEGNGGVIPGKSLKALHSDVLKDLRGRAVDNYPGMRERLGDFQQLLEDAADRQITSPGDKAKYQTARVQYAKAKAIEPLVARGGINGVSPQALLQQLNSTGAGKHRMAIGAAGELGDLAQIAQNFMRELPTSNTAERSAAIGAVLAPFRAVGGIAAGQVYNRIARPFARATVRNSIDDVPPVRFANELDFAMEPAFAPKPSAPSGAYEGLLTAEQSPIPQSRPQTPQLATDTGAPSVDFPMFETQPMPIQRAGERMQTAPNPGIAADNGIDFYGNQPAPPAAPIREPSLLSLADQPQFQPQPAPSFPNAGGNAIDFPLRQEVLQQPEIVASVNAYRSEAARLQQIAENAISQPVRQKARGDLVRLQEEFAAGMRQLGIRNSSEAIGMQPLFESGGTPRLEIQRTFDPRERNQVNAERTRLKLQRIGDAQTIDEAIKAASE